jgi:hypothetical protein
MTAHRKSRGGKVVISGLKPEAERLVVQRAGGVV